MNVQPLVEPGGHPDFVKFLFIALQKQERWSLATKFVVVEGYNFL